MVIVKIVIMAMVRIMVIVMVNVRDQGYSWCKNRLKRIGVNGKSK